MGATRASSALPPLPGPPATMVLMFQKPYGVLSQFTPEPGSRWRTLAEFGFPPGVYPIGRLDADSEGLLLLGDEPALNTRLLDPRCGHWRRYWAQVEGVPDDASLERLRRGIVLRGERTRPCRALRLEPPPELPPRDPPIRVRRQIPDSWIALELCEGRNRQVRRMTAAVGHPTLRLIRVAIGGLELTKWNPGHWRPVDSDDRRRLFAPVGARPQAGMPTLRDASHGTLEGPAPSGPQGVG